MKGALDAGLVAVQAIQVFFELFGCSCGVRAGPDLHAADTAEIPGGGNQVVEHAELDGVLGCDIGLVSVQELLEFLAFMWLDDYVTGGESVGASVLRRAGPTFWGTWSGAVLRIGSVGSETCWRSLHIFYPSSSLYADGGRLLVV